MTSEVTPNETRNKILMFQKESDSWKRTLAFLTHENAELKVRLGELLTQTNGNVDILQAAEDYQSTFLQKDQIIRLIQHDIAELDQLLKDSFQKKTNVKEIVQKQKKYRTELRSLETEFAQLKLQFNNYFSEAI